MKAYKSHKTVEAGKITRILEGAEDSTNIFLDDATGVNVTDNWVAKHQPEVDGYLVRYPDGYLSYSPAAAFEEGYTPHSLDPKDGALPVAGYKPQSPEKVAMVNGFKEDEERLLRKLDDMAAGSAADADRRWLAIGRTQLEQAFMAINRAVFQPGRAKLPEDAPPAGGLA